MDPFGVKYWSHDGVAPPTRNGSSALWAQRVPATARVTNEARTPGTSVAEAAIARAEEARAAAIASSNPQESEPGWQTVTRRQPRSTNGPQHTAYVAQVVSDSVEVDVRSLPSPQDFAHLAVPLQPGEVVYDPGATAEMGSLTAWQQLDSAMKERYGAEYGFTTRPTQTTFRVADGNSTTPKGATAFQAVFDIPSVGCFTLAGVGIPCSKQEESAQTPVLFGCVICKELRLVMDHDTDQLHSKALGVTVQCRRAQTRHLLLSIFDFLDAAGAHPLPKTFVESAWTAIPSTLEPYPADDISKND